MRRMRSVADEDGVVVEPRAVADANKAGPRGRRRECVRMEAVAVEPRGEQRFAGRHGAWQVEAVEAGVPPRGVVTFDDAGGRLGIEAVAMRLENTMRVLDEIKRERLEGKRRAEPDVLGFPDIEVRLEVSGVTRAHCAVDAVGRHDQIRAGQPGAPTTQSP